ncbi:zinc carboxypeptidase, partial [bacterium]|nr:zinc carboxypeptidase [bacterium]
MKLKSTMVIIAVLIIGTVSSAIAEEPPYLLVRVDISGPTSLIPLFEMGLDIVESDKKTYLDLVAHPDEYARIQALGYQAEIKIDDMVRHYQDQSGSDDMGGYHTWSEMVAEITQVHADHPLITTAPFSIGQTIEGREMHVIKISDNPEIDEDEPEVFFNALTHAREPIGVELCLELIHRLTDDYGSDPYITDLVDTREIFVLPVFNVDGYVYNETINPFGGGMWRKNRRDNGGSFGVDLNRNWGYDWGYDNIGSSGVPSSSTYRGTAPFSEPETDNVRQFCNQRNFSVGLNIHSYSNLMMYSWSGSHNGYVPENTAFETISTVMYGWNSYTYGPGWMVLYEMNGDANDWMYGEQMEKPRIMAWLFEIGSSFWPPASAIPGLVAENMQPCLYLIEQAGDYMSPYVTLDPLGAPIQIPAMGGSFDFDVTVSNNAPDAITTDIWFDVMLPDSNIFGPILGPAEITIPASSSISRLRTQAVPGNAPHGIYNYNVYTGGYPDITWHTASFEFEKTETTVGVTQNGWENSGESFDDTSDKEMITNSCQLITNSPNPFNPSTVFSYQLPADSQVTLAVYDLQG